MKPSRKTAAVICPGRGTYNKAEHGYLERQHRDKAPFLDMVDAYRRSQKQTSIRELDSNLPYSLALHSRGDNASPLIYACSYCDFLSIDRATIEVVAVTGNSMGWYTALACGGVLSAEDALSVVNTMGTYMQEALIGGQIVHTMVDEEWRSIPGRRTQLLDLISAVNSRAGCVVSVSIELGGMIVLAGNDAGLEAFLAEAPVGPGRFPMRLQNHAAFHSALQAPISAKARATLPVDWFGGPNVPLIDGRGHIWRPFASNPEELWDYTFGAQVTETYDFTVAVQVAAREFAPDHVIILGPGDTLGGAVAQSLSAINWRNLDSKAAFANLQRVSPYVLAMGRDDQRRMAIGAEPLPERKDHANTAA